MGSQWIDPSPGNTCPTCLHYVGRVFPDGEELPLPAHPGCECFYMHTDEPGTAVNWDEEPDHARDLYTNYAAWLLRDGQELPPSLRPLREDAERVNKEREENSMSRIRLNQYGAVAGVDRANYVIRGVSAMQAVEALGHNAIIDGVTLQQFAYHANQKPAGLKSRFTHPGLSADGLGKFLGRFRDVRVIGDKAVGDLYLAEAAAKSPGGDLREYVMSLAEEDAEAFGMSAVLTADRVWLLDDGTEIPADGPRPDNATTEKPLFRVMAAHAVDAVDEPAANRDGVFSAFSGTTSELAADAFAVADSWLGYYPFDRALEMVEEFARHGRCSSSLVNDRVRGLIAEMNVSDDKARQFAAQYLLHRRRGRSRGEIIILTADNRPMEEEMSKTVDVADETAVAVAPIVNNGDDGHGQKNGSAWLAELSAAGTQAILANSDLPAAVRRRLARGRYDDPAQLRAAIAEAEDELAELSVDGVVSLPGRPITARDMTTSLDRAQRDIDWFFGVEGAPLPAGNMRSIRDMYLAMTGDWDFHGAFIAEQVMLAGADTSTLANMAVNAMNKVIAAQFSSLTHWRWYEQVAMAAANDGSVQDMQWISFGGIGNLPTVAERGAYTELDVDDVKEADSFTKYGGYVGITLEMIRNSNIQQIQAAPRALAISAVRTRSAKIAAIFTVNSGTGPTLDQDATVLFAAGHGSNVQTTAFGTDATAWRAARAECFQHPEVNSGKVLGIFPKYALVPVDLYDTALSVFGYGDGYPTAYTPEARDRGPDDPRPVPLVVPDWTDANDWAYVTDPRVHPVIMMSYAQSPGGGSHPAPELFAVTSPTAGMVFTNDTLPIKVRDWFAYGVNGWRGIGKRNVT